MYSLLCRHGKFSLLPNQQAADEELSAYKYGPSSQAVASSPLKRFLERHKKLRTALLIVVLFGASMVIGDGVLTPSISGGVLKFVSQLDEVPDILCCTFFFMIKFDPVSSLWHLVSNANYKFLG